MFLFFLQLSRRHALVLKSITAYVPEINGGVLIGKTKFVHLNVHLSLLGENHSEIETESRN